MRKGQVDIPHMYNLIFLFAVINNIYIQKERLIGEFLALHELLLYSIYPLYNSLIK